MGYFNVITAVSIGIADFMGAVYTTCVGCANLTCNYLVLT